MRLVTWNVNSLRARLPRVLEFLAEHEPDVLCLQETKTDPDAFPHAELAEAGYVAADHSAGRWAGVAVVAREQLGVAAVRRGLAGEPIAEEARWVEATVGELRVVSVYVPNGRELASEWYEQKLSFFDAMAARAGALVAAGGELVVAGDMNVAPADVDVYDPAAFVQVTHTSAPERAALKGVVDAGLVDAYRALHPEEVGFTWWDYRQGHFHRGLGMRIDLTLVSPSIGERLTRVGIERDYRKGSRPSDHVPLVADWA
ncbi:exodeoxyribonuclease III [Conexibacter sp. JD483]|uniref:exodeoxyribonuclease III n=1 Tax=unclassified Conexibacter TaxID=2627773 RepID=UPI002719F8DA|nr:MULTISPECIES: exodeoxyribonuclease III [unclassified Conexibacter]MDO8186255.1 exodeoxyribonuclease III [Conexibacter sp. CPCC 205706]MDO8199678.1 exodeoxyribonuclease III [Conexibacter sp. CPCC 205762]MDR9372492.1 exodeoxyribonuclease III [Conexibacter sp. JD483]